ncbi:hypothetical protein [Sporohalobacter salinus]|uniref:hypothetical protein n=1 Tax=Sporohalobacter salinus TaxID=1494606 RepID=UPI00196220DE|nr:hypothetical protein [Sporohalobacter salinus]MBM7622825.1 hypothetical protein [Sporohalobacter salinus]
MEFKIDYFRNGMMLNKNFEITATKAKLIEEVIDLKNKGAKVEKRPFGTVNTKDLRKQIIRIEFWESITGRKKLIFIVEDGSKIVVEEPINDRRIG